MSDTKIIARPSLQVFQEEVHVPLRLKSATPANRRWPRALGLLTGLSVALFMFFTDGGGSGLYSATYDQLEGTERLLRKITPSSLPLFSDRSEKDKYRLQGIIYSSLRPMAVINQQTCAPGEVISVPVGRSDELIHCVQIDQGFVDIRTPQGQDARLSLP